MILKWFGHACFLITSENGTRVLTDPFDEKVGYPLPEAEADIVTTSHSHYDHNNVGIVRGAFQHLDKPGAYLANGIEIKGISTFHDADSGAKRGENTVFVFKIDGIRLCHCGDLGHALTPGQVEEIGEVDILLVPVGGVYTVDAAGAAEVMRQLKPAITIPMHYKTKALSFFLDGPDKFLDRAGGGRPAGKRELEITRESLSSYPGIIVMEYR